MEQSTLRMLNEGFMRKYLKEAEEFEKETETSEDTDTEIEVGDLFTKGDETYKLLDVQIDEDGNVVVEAENQETEEPEEIEYISKDEAEDMADEEVATDDYEEDSQDAAVEDSFDVEDADVDIQEECLNEGEIGKKVGRVAGGFVGHPEIGSKVGDVIEDKAKAKFNKFKQDNNLTSNKDAAVELARRGGKLASRGVSKLNSVAGKISNAKNNLSRSVAPQPLAEGELGKTAGSFIGSKFGQSALGGRIGSTIEDTAIEAFEKYRDAYGLTNSEALLNIAKKAADTFKNVFSPDEEDEDTDLVYESINFKKLRECAKSLKESPMSPEDAKDNAILRNIINKSISRKNAKLTPEEKDVLAKYGLYRNDWGEVRKDRGKGNLFNDPEIVKPDELNYSFQGRTRTRTGFDPKKDKVNLADRARKMDDRGAGYEANNVWTPSDPSREFKRHGESTYTRLKGKGLLDKERALQNTRMQGNYNSMQQALKDRKYYQNRLDNIDSNADAEIAKLRSRIDAINKKREVDRKYDSDSVARQQSTINKLLRKEESLSEELLDRHVSDFNSDVYNALSKVMLKWDRKDIQPSPEDMDKAYEWFSTHFYESDDWY